MGGAKIELAKEALMILIKSLNSDCYFNIVSFGSNTRPLFTNSQRASDSTIETALNEVGSIQADMGGTEM